MLGNLSKRLKKPWATVTSLVTCDRQREHAHVATPEDYKKVIG